MRVWGKMSAGPRHTIGVARAALAGKGQHDLLSDAVQTLLATGEADRFGAWVEFADDASGDPSRITSFRGIVADTENDPTPGEGPGCLPSPHCLNNCWWTCKLSSRS
jgi:hypothetical protein